LIDLIVYVFSTALIVSFLSSLLLIKLFKSIGHVGLDVHKPCRVEVAESVGLSIMFSLIVSSILVYIYGFRVEAIAFTLSIILAGSIGFLDDFLVLRARYKILLGIIPSIPIIALGVYEPRPLIPLDGLARLTIVYPLLLPIVYTISTNGFNMYDTHNGVMLASALIMALAMVFAGYIQYSAGFEESINAIIFGIALLGAIIGLLYFNLYPAKAFNGDVGSFTIGAAIASIAIIGRVEAIALIAGLPIALNGFLKVSTIGFVERRGFERPVYMDGWIIKPKISHRAPLSLPVLLTSRVPLSEPELVIAEIWLIWFTSILSLITLYITLARLVMI